MARRCEWSEKHRSFLFLHVSHRHWRWDEASVGPQATCKVNGSFGSIMRQCHVHEATMLNKSLCISLTGS